MKTWNFMLGSRKVIIRVRLIVVFGFLFTLNSFASDREQEPQSVDLELLEFFMDFELNDQDQESDMSDNETWVDPFELELMFSNTDAQEGGNE